jgi:cytochrome c peroxidase
MTYFSRHTLASLRWPPRGLFTPRLFMPCLFALSLAACGGSRQANETPKPDSSAGSTDVLLAAALQTQGYTGKIEQGLEQRLGRPVDARLADVGRMLFFDRVSSLHNDNSCAGCHSPSHAFGDTQSIAIGIQNNNLVGPGRTGPRNQRRTPGVVNTAFYPSLMWNGRFFAASGDPFNNAGGFTFPAPEGATRFTAKDPLMRHLLIAQAHLPPTELNEVAGFTGIRSGIDARLFQFDDGLGDTLPDADADGFRNDAIRAAVVERLNASPAYVTRFAEIFAPASTTRPLDIAMFARAIAEFEFTLVRANAPIDQFARGDTAAMSVEQKRGALLFMGKANCVACHAVGGSSNEMFSDFKMHNIGVPQIAPRFGAGAGNTIFDGPGEDEDFGLAQISGQAADRYKFRTSPLRNVALQPAFFHNGAFTTLEDAIRHHLDAAASLKNYNASSAGVATDLRGRLAPVANVAATIDPLLRPVQLTTQEFADLLAFVRDGLLDPRARPVQLCTLIPAALPSGAALPVFQSCP